MRIFVSNNRSLVLLAAIILSLSVLVGSTGPILVESVGANNFFFLVIVVLGIASVIFITRPVVIVSLLAFSLPFMGLSLLNIGFGLQPSFALGLALFCTVIVHPKRGLRTNRAMIVLGLFLLLAAMSILLSGYAPLAHFRGEEPFLKGVKEWLGLLLMVGAVYGIVMVIREEKQYVQSVRGLLIGAAFAAIYGLYQFFGLYFDLPLTNIFNNNISFEAASHGQVIGGLRRIWSTAPEPLFFGNFMIAVLPVVLSLNLSGKKLFKKSFVENAFLLILYLGAFLLTVSRGAYLGMIASVLVLLVLKFERGDKPLGKLLFVILLSLVIVGSLGLIMKRRIDFSQIDNFLSELSFEDNLERYVLMRTGLSVFRAHPLAGVGLGNFGFYYTTYRYPIAPSIPTDSHHWPITHNMYIQILAEMGLIGFSVFCIFLWFLFRDTYVICVQKDSRTMIGALQTGFLASLAGMLVQFLTMSGFRLSHFWFVVGMLIAGINICRNYSGSVTVRAGLAQTSEVYESALRRRN